MGRWYELIRSSYWREPLCPTMEFTATDDGRVLENYTYGEYERPDKLLSKLWSALALNKSFQVELYS